jgi:cytoskeletal protein CcmA (bactofilin family)
MFAKSVPAGGISSKDAETIIGSSVKVEGNFACEGNMIVDGEVRGKIATDGFLQVGDKALIEAEVKAGNGKISGVIKGNIKVDGYLELTSTAKVTGDMKFGSISIERGAVVNGRCTMAETGDQAEAKNAKDKKANESDDSAEDEA